VAERWTGRADIAWCPNHGLHGARSHCFICCEPVEQIPMVPIAELEALRGPLRALIHGPSREPLSLKAACGLLEQAGELAEEALAALEAVTTTPQNEEGR